MLTDTTLQVFADSVYIDVDTSYFIPFYSDAELTLLKAERLNSTRSALTSLEFSSENRYMYFLKNVSSSFNIGYTGVDTTHTIDSITFAMGDVRKGINGSIFASGNEELIEISDAETVTPVVQTSDYGIDPLYRFSVAFSPQLLKTGPIAPNAKAGYTRKYDQKYYELTDHLGNVRVVINDFKERDASTGALWPSAVSYNDYYTFGMMLPARKFTSENYRYGFNGQEKSDEIKGEGNSNTATFWEYDMRLGRRWNLDPKPHPSWSSYLTFGNNPVQFSDPLGDTIKINFFPIRTFAKNFLSDLKNIFTGKGLVFYKVGESYIKEKCNDGNFAVFAHGSAIGFTASSRDGQSNENIFDAKGFDRAMSRMSKEWEKAKGQNGTHVTFYSCEIASDEYVTSNNEVKKIDINFAEQVSKAFPNILVTAPNGELVFGEAEDGTPILKGITTKNNDGAFITYKNGVEVDRKKFNYKTDENKSN